MRNSNSYTASKWDYSVQTNYMNNWSYYLLKSNGEFAVTEVIPGTLVVNETIYSSRYWSTINDDLSSYDVRTYSQEMKLKEWVDKQYEEGRVTVLTDNKLENQINVICEEYGMPMFI